jgi:AcrR family transcriptional regulator
VKSDRAITAGGLAGAAPPAHQAERAGQGGRGQQTGQPGRDKPANQGGRGQRRAGRRKVAVLEAAGRVIAERGADATRFADVAAASGVPVSTLQYYFGSREDLLVAAFRHASATEIAELETEIAGLDDPWQQLTRVVTSAVTGYEDAAAGSGRLWIESWHLGIRDAEMRADAIRDYGAWRALVAGVVRRGRDAGAFAPRLAPEHVAVLTIALVDGVGIPLALGDPQITADGAVADVLAALRDVLHATGQAG